MTALAAENARERAEALTRLTERLTALIEQETALFNARRPHETQDIQDEKAKLAALYRREVSAIAQDRSRVETADEAVRRALARATDAFTVALTANGAAVEALRTLTEGLVKSVAEEAARQQEDLGGYGPGSGRAAGAAPAIALNRTA